jgi:N-acetylmuramoyl-L-alanine amidase
VADRPTGRKVAAGKPRPGVLACAAALLWLAAACGPATAGPDQPERPDPPSLTPPSPSGVDPAATGAGAEAPNPARRTGNSPPTTGVPPIPAGAPDRPFQPLPASDGPTALVSPGGAVLPVVPAPGAQRDAGHHAPGATYDADEAGRWLVLTPCAEVRSASAGWPLGRAHVVLDPGHGGREPGAVGPSGLAEKDLNLAVALAARSELEALGATVILTRATDVTMTTRVRAYLARSVQPGLFVSIHHNGGAPAGGDRPGTIVFTKSASPASRRFGGLFYEALTALLGPIGEARQEEHRLYRQALASHEATVAAYDQSLAAREAALVANGQIPPTATTSPPAAAASGDDHNPSLRHPITTTTAAPPPGQSTVEVPGTLPLPPPFEAEPVPPFGWAGSPNAGVRSWIDDGGDDVLSVLRRSGEVPAAVVEYLYLTNPAEEALLADPAFVDAEAQALVDAVVAYFATRAEGTGFVAGQVGDQDIGGGGRAGCVDPDLLLGPGPRRYVSARMA